MNDSSGGKMCVLNGCGTVVAQPESSPPRGMGRELGEEEFPDKALEWRKEKLHTPAKQWVGSPFPKGRQVLGQDKSMSRVTPSSVPMVWDIPGAACAPQPSQVRWGAGICSAIIETSLCSQQLPAQIQVWLCQLLQRKLTVSQPNPEWRKFSEGMGFSLSVVCQTFRIPGILISFSPFYQTSFLITQYQTSGSGKIKRSKCLPQLLLSDLIWYELPWALLSFCQEIYAQW